MSLYHAALPISVGSCPRVGVGRSVPCAEREERREERREGGKCAGTGVEMRGGYLRPEVLVSETERPRYADARIRAYRRKAAGGGARQERHGDHGRCLRCVPVDHVHREDVRLSLFHSCGKG